jgi:hypothetical protein
MIVFISIWTLPAIVSRPESILYRHATFLPNLGLIDVTYRKWNEKPKVDSFKETTAFFLSPYQKILFYPLEKNSQIQHQYAKAALSQGKLTNASLLNLLGESSRLSFLGKENIAEENQKITRDLESGQIDSSALYVFQQSASTLVKLFSRIDVKYDALFFSNDVMILAPNWKKFQQFKFGDLPQQYNLNIPKEIQMNRQISFAYSRDGRNPLLAFGWHDFSEEWGTWSVGKHAQLILPIPSGEPKILQLKFRAYILGAPQNQLVQIAFDGQYKQSFILEKFEGNIVEIQISPFTRGKEYIILDFGIPNARSPFSIAVSDDKRQLGIGIQSAKFN